eukprot:1980567-Prymnesium_polylepis.1
MSGRQLSVGLSGYGGLNNHRETITAAAVYAIVLNRTLILPHALPNAHGRPVPLEGVWDLRRLRRLVPAILVGRRTPAPPHGGSSSVTAMPWCCDVDESDIRSSAAANDASPLLTFHAAGGWVFPTPYFAASLARLVGAIANCAVPQSLMRCASALAVRMQSALLERSAFNAAQGAGVSSGGPLLHAAHLRLGGKVPCPLIECSECGMATRDLGGLQHRNCDCKKRVRPPPTAAGWSAGEEGSLGVETAWRDARSAAWRRGEEWEEASASLIDAIDCGIAHGRYRRGDGFYVATNQPHDAQTEQLVEALHRREFRAFRWADLARPDADSSARHEVGGRTTPTANASRAGDGAQLLSLDHLDSTCRVGCPRWCCTLSAHAHEERLTSALTTARALLGPLRHRRRLQAASTRPRSSSCSACARRGATCPTL